MKHFHITDTKAVLESHDGLLGSDAGWYQTIAAHGYGALPRSATRFFPLLPLLDRGLHDVTSLTVGVASLLITNLAALLLGMGIYALVRSEWHDTVLARRAVWLIMLAPPAFVFVMGYSEALLVLLAVAFFLAIRRGTWWWAALFGYLAGTARPIGCLLVVPAVIEVVRSWPADRWGRWPGKVAAIVSSVAGTVTYLALGQSHLRRIPRAAQGPAAAGPPRRPHRPGLDRLPLARRPGPRAPHRRRAPCPVDRRRRGPARPGVLAPPRVLRGLRPLRRRRRVVRLEPRFLRALRAQRLPARDGGLPPCSARRASPP